MRIVAGADTDFDGTAETGHNVTQTFFAQHQLEALHLDNAVLQELQAFAPKHTETELRSILGSFLFTGDDVFKKIRVLSGGEKSRVALAKALTADANFLVLDEPTNHLDMQSVNILIQALQQFEGTFILVSHDRYLLDSVANKIWFIENRKIKEYPGTYQEYEDWQQKRPATAKADTSANKTKKEPAKAPDAKHDAAAQERKKEANKLNRDLEQLEQEIAEKEVALKDLETKLADEQIYQNPERLAQTTESYEALKATLATLQQDWEKLAEQIMALE